MFGATNVIKQRKELIEAYNFDTEEDGKIVCLTLDNYEKALSMVSKDPLFVETLERICNEKDDMFFYNHILTNNGYHRAPGKIHDMLRDEFGLADIDIVETEKTIPVEVNVEWWVAHFIIQLQGEIFNSLLFQKMHN